MKIIKYLTSRDKRTIKYLQETKDRHIIETGYYNLDEHIVCISSQIGCPMGCIFCATTAPIDLLKNANKRFIRNLTSREIVAQAKNVLCLVNQKNLKSKRILFSYMGMGEPFLNYENVVESIKILSKLFPNSRTTVSTIGIRPGFIKKLAHERINTILKLHLSLHASTDALRKKILPASSQIKPTLDALKYFSSTRNTPAKVNYILIKNINDSKRQAIQLAKLLKPYSFTAKLSNLNDFKNLKSSGKNKFKMFEKVLNSSGVQTSRFFSAGIDIEAGCGQLRRHFYGERSPRKN